MNERDKKTYSLSLETIARVIRLGQLTHRSESHVVDWAVDEIWRKMEEVQRPSTTIEQAEAEAQAIAQTQADVRLLAPTAE
jgi:hypothetical protein